MRTPMFFAIAILSFSHLASAEGDAEAGAAKAASCAACHNAKISLQGEGADNIVEQMEAIIAGDTKHPPGLAGLKAEDLADIAAYLDTAD